jgi:hypothetical protein
MANPALFVGGHPDDLFIAMASAICKHLAASPGQDIHVMLATKGEASAALNKINGLSASPFWNNILHVPAAEGYSEFDAVTFGDARLLEEWAAMRTLSAGLPGRLHIHELPLYMPDGFVNSLDVFNAILNYCDSVDSGTWRLKGHTYLPSLEDHPDHRAVGQAIADLAATYPTRFWDARFYVMPNHWSDGDLSTVSWAWDMPNATTTPRVKNAMRCFMSWGPDRGVIAAGGHSVQSLLETVGNTQKSMYHLP